MLKVKAGEEWKEATLKHTTTEETREEHGTRRSSSFPGEVRERE